MSKYLDLSGLTTLWNKIKQSFLSLGGGVIHGNITADNFIVSGSNSGGYLKGDGNVEYSKFLKVYNYNIQYGKGVRIKYGYNDLVIITLGGTNQDTQMVLIGLGYGGQGTLRNKFIELISSDNWKWSLPMTDNLSKCIDIFCKASQDNNIQILSPNNITFTPIDSLYSPAQNNPLIDKSTFDSEINSLKQRITQLENK